MSYPKYELDMQMLHDIIAKVPEERWDALCADLPELLRTQQTMNATFDVISLICGGEVERQQMKTFHWVDDGDTSTTVNLRENHSDGTSIETTLNSKEIFKHE